jgi:hypothetical protein
VHGDAVNRGGMGEGRGQAEKAGGKGRQEGAQLCLLVGSG